MHENDHFILILSLLAEEYIGSQSALGRWSECQADDFGLFKVFFYCVLRTSLRLAGTIGSG